VCTKAESGKKENLRMREVVFRVLPIRITAPTLEELQHGAREALIEHLEPAHGTVRVRVRRPAALCR
jgi:Mg/Co/Ni transporter MgtE